MKTKTALLNALLTLQKAVQVNFESIKVAGKLVPSDYTHVVGNVDTDGWAMHRREKYIDSKNGDIVYYDAPERYSFHATERMVQIKDNGAFELEQIIHKDLKHKSDN